MFCTDKYGVDFTDNYEILISCPSEYEGSYTVPDGVEVIGTDAFKGCEKLTAIVLPNSIEKIEKGAFCDCKKLKDIYYHGDMQQWLQNVEVEALASTGYNLWLHDGSQYIKVETVIIPEGISEIRNNAFYYCESVKHIKFNSHLTKIGDSAFNKSNFCLSLQIPSSVTYIGRYAFFCCNNLRNVTIPESVAHIGAMSFSFCRTLRGFDVSEENDHFCTNDSGTLLYDKFKTKLYAVAIGCFFKSYRIEKSCKSIEDGAFLGATSGKVYLPKLTKKVKDIDRNKCEFYIPYGQKDYYIKLGFPKGQLKEECDYKLLIKGGRQALNIVEKNPFRVLGVPINASAKEITSNSTKIKRFSIAGKEVQTSYDFTAYLPAIKRTQETVTAAISQITLPNDKLKYALYWCACLNEGDKDALALLDAKDIGAYYDYYDVKENFVSDINMAFADVIRGARSIDGFVLSIIHLCDNYSAEFIRVVCGDSYSLTSDELLHLALDVLIDECDDIHLYLMLRGDVDDVRATEYVKDALVSRISSSLNSEVSSTKSISPNDSVANYKAAHNLMAKTKDSIGLAKELLTETDTRYAMLADSLAKQILQLGINYYNSSPDDDFDAPEKAMEIQSYAESLAVGKLAKERCQENTKILKRILSSTPPSCCQNIDKEIEQYIDSNIIFEIGDVVRVLESLANKLSKVKTLSEEKNLSGDELERFEMYFTSLSTKIADRMLSKAIDIVNEKFESGNRNSISTFVNSAWRIISYIDSMDLDPSFRENRFAPNMSTMRKIYGQVNPSWQTPPALKLTILSEGELYPLCENSMMYCKKYLELYPNGKHIQKINGFIEELEWKACKTVDSYKRFIEKYPTSSKCSEAKNRMRVLGDELGELSKISSREALVVLYMQDKYKVSPYKEVLDQRFFELCNRKAHYKKYIEVFGTSGKHYSAASKKAEASHSTAAFILGLLLVAIIGGCIGARDGDFWSGFFIGIFVNCIFPIVLLPAHLIEKALDRIL
jgi:hypothetical protein